MKCANEFILSQYADGELPESETRELAAHLEDCRTCREQVADLRAENLLLVESLKGIDLYEPERQAVSQKRPEFTNLDRLAAVSIGVAILFRIVLGFVQDAELPLAVQWLHPWSLSGLLNWLLNGIFYLLDQGGSIMTHFINEAGYLVLVLLILGGSLVLARRVIRTKAILGLISLMIVFVAPGYSIDVRRADKGRGDVSVAINETVNDTLVVFGDSVNIRGTITGDLIAFARNIEIQGTVQGNFIGFAQRVDVSGNVQGDILAFGQSIQADGQIGQNLWGFGQTLTLGRNTRLPHDATLFGSNVYIKGNVGRDASVYSGTLDFESQLGRDLHFRGGQIVIRGPSVIGRNLNILTQDAKMVRIDPTVTILGKKIVEFAKPEASRYSSLGFYGKQGLRIGAAFFMGLLLFWIVPGMRRISLSTGKAMLNSGGIGFLIAVAAPVGAIILAITLVGIPMALLVIVLWLLGLYLAKIVVAICIGSAILQKGSPGSSSTALPLIIGLLIVIVAVNLPFVGGILNFLLMLIGLGALVTTGYRMRTEGASEN